MGESASFKQGDVVIHPRKPEWGPGVVKHATTIDHEGRSAQRVVVDFSNHGRATINTAIAPLVSKDDFPIMTATPHPAFETSAPASPTVTPSARGWLDSIGNGQANRHELWALPEGLTDPFLSPIKRLTHTLDTYRYGNDAFHARNVLDWAVAQTGLTDPMTRYNRTEMEQAFRRFLRDRDNHLADLVRSIKRQGKLADIHEVLRGLPSGAAKEGLQRALQR